MSLVNLQNFLRWDDGQSAATVEGDIAEGYLQDRNRCDYKPLFAASEALRFYINAPAGLAFIDDANTYFVGLYRADGTLVNASLATPQVHTFNVSGGTAKTFYAEVVIDNTVAPGPHYLAIIESDPLAPSDVVVLTSNQIMVLPAGTDHRNYSSLVKFRHDRYFYGINYQDISDFTQQFRLHINLIETQYDEDKEVYSEVTTGKQRTYNNFMKKVRTAETYYFDKYAHDAAAILFQHDEIYINLKKYTAKGVYKINTDQRARISKGTCDLYDEEFASANRCTD